MIIAKAAIESYLGRKFNSYLWMKKLARDDILDEIAQLKVKPTFKTDPWTHQAACFMIGLAEPNFLFLLDMGLGKTWIILNLLTQFIREKKVNRGLIIARNLSNLGTWEANTLEHSNLEPWLCLGSVEEKWERLLNPQGDLAVVDYAGLHLALTTKVKRGRKHVLVRDDKKVAQLRSLYNFTTMDESHKAKNKETLRFGILRQLTKFTQYNYATTGTLFGRNVEDLWAQFFLIDRGETFGDTIGMFRAGFFKETYHHWKGTVFKFDKKKTRDLYRRLQHKSISYEYLDCPDLPAMGPRRPPIQLKVKFTDEQWGHYMRAVDGLIAAQGKLREVDNAWIRMRQIVAGYLDWNDEYGHHHIEFKHNPKIEALESLIEEAGDTKLVISHEYTPSGQLIVNLAKKMGLGFEWLYGGAKARDKVGAVGRFMDQQSKKLFIMNSESGGTGTDGLQKVARYMIYFESPVSPITRAQTDRRVDRPGQRYPNFIYDIVMDRSMDKGILADLKEGKSLYESVVSGRAKKADFFG